MTSENSAAPRDVSVFGTDVTGRPFFQSARALCISRFEVTILGLQRTLEVNSVIGVRYGTQKARFRVMWVGAEGTPQQGQIGLRAVEPEKDIFWLEVERRSAPLAAPSFAGRERRRYPRIPCHGSVKFRCEGTITPTAGELQVLSEGGCYIETLSTAPRFSHLDLTVNADGLELRATGVVRDSQAGCRMGIAFREMEPAYLCRLQDWVFQHSRP